MRLASAAALACLVLAGCGSTSAPAPRRHASAAPCPPKLRAAVGPQATGRVVSSEPLLVTCRYTTPQATVDITLDDGPQAWRRWTRAQVERTQAAVEWSHTPRDRPRDVEHVGAGAFWVIATRELQASDGRRLIVVRVRRPLADAAARRLAVRVAPAGLGRIDVPVATGP